MIDSERRLVATLLDNFPLAYSKINGVAVNMFTDKTSRVLFEAIITMKEEGERIDMIAVANNAGMKLFELSEYTDLSFPSVESIEHDCHVIVKEWQGREIINTLKTYSASSDEPEKLSDEVIEKLGSIINQTTGEIDNLASDVEKWRKAYEDEFNGVVKVGVKCGYGFIDKVTHGYKPGNLIVIGARTGVGKTTFALNQAVNMARDKIAVGVISMEMTQNELIDKILGIRSNINQEDIHAVKDKAVFSRIMTETTKIEGMPIFLNAPRSDNPDKIFNIIKQMVFKRGVKCVFLDYLQLMSYPQQSQNRNYEIGKMTRKLKMLAGELHIPIVVLSQLKRRDGNPTPTLNDLRDSGSIEQDANIVLFLHQVGEDQEDVPDVDIDCIIAKNRGGGKGFRSLYFRKQISLISAREVF